MKTISVESARRFVKAIENIFYSLHLDDATWNEFDAITDQYFGRDLNEIDDEITEEIAIVWDISDVQIMRPDLTEQQASTVLIHLEKHHDSGVGINWEIVEMQAEDLFPETENIECEEDSL